jgi:tyrosyl-tRNA synthetase
MVKIRNQANTEAGERGAETRHRNAGAQNLNLVPRVRRAIDSSANQSTYAARHERLDRCAPAYQHRIMIMDCMSDLFFELEWRGLVYDATQGAKEMLARDKVTVYLGCDPSAPSLHVGTLMQMMLLSRLQRAGHSPIALVGGGTGMIGDPSGKTAERTLQTREVVDANVRGIRAQLERFLDFDAPNNPARLVDNGEWLNSMTAMEFLRDVGKYFTVNYLLAKESVKRRIESEEGISYTEFSYSLLQAYDFLVLHDRFNCRLQIGGSDQWGNIVAGTDLIRKLRAVQTHGVVSPLLLTSSGTKFGKTEAGTVWLDPALTSPFQFYQFWFNTDDRDVISYLKFFTFKSLDEIAELERETNEHPEKREAARELAREVTALVHGADQVARAERAAAVLFGGPLNGASVEDILMVFGDAPSISIAAASIERGIGAADLAVAAGLTASKGEAGRLIKQGGLYVNDRRLNDERGQVTMADAIGRAVIVLRKGQRERRIVKIER